MSGRSQESSHSGPSANGVQVPSIIGAVYVRLSIDRGSLQSQSSSLERLLPSCCPCTGLSLESMLSTIRSDRSHVSARPITSRSTAISPTRFSSRVNSSVSNQPSGNGPYTLYMTAIGDNKLPYGSLPRLLMAWISTEAVQTQSRELVAMR